MFAKGPRCPPEKLSEAPGPGHYKLPEEFRHEAYKKGAFLEKADRFGMEKESDAPGPGTYNTAPRDSNSRPGPSKPQPMNHGLTHLQQQIETLKSQNARLQKEHHQTLRKYEEKVAHQESTIKSLVKDNVGLQSQVSIQQREHRSVCQRETALRTALEKIETTHKSEGDRASKLAGLQRRFQDLEKVHADDKKKHQVEMEQLKGELDGSRRASAEQTERLAQLRKRMEASESHTKDFKKAIIADQAEIKDLRTKLRDASQAKSQASFQQAEVDQLKKALHILETKHKTELRDRDAKLAEQEKNFTVERKRRELSELQAQAFKSKADAEAKDVKERNRRLEDELNTFKESAEVAQITALEDRWQLDNLRATMSRVAEAYGRLAASSVQLVVHRQSLLQCTSLQLRNIRLERRLADREALVQQLTDYCRQASEEKEFLSRLLREAEEEHNALSITRTAVDDDLLAEDTSLVRALFHVCEDARYLHDTAVQNDLQSAEAMLCFYQTEFQDLLVSYAMAHGEGVQQSAVVAHLAGASSGLRTEVDALRLDYCTAEAELSAKSIQIAEAATRERLLDERLSTLKSDAVQLEDALKGEREANRRLAQAANQNKKNEDVLRLEVDQLVEDLADVTRYKEAHADLLAEVVELIQRNELVEEEAERLGKFNAEILGHTNPQQKIFYVDRIRRELAEIKHRLMQSTRDREDLAADNAALQHEVAAYKSVAVPIDLKPRSNRIRIERSPLASRSVNRLTQSITFELTPPPEEEPIDMSPMTLEEIM